MYGVEDGACVCLCWRKVRRDREGDGYGGGLYTVEKRAEGEYL